MSSTPGTVPTSVTTTRLVNGVFRGGGAKVIAYAGALQEVRARGLWFGSVTGSSGGAIVASLIAAGMEADDLARAIPDGLAAVRSPVLARLGKAVIGHATSVFEGTGLRVWLDETLAREIGATGRGPVTFADLHRASGIELSVVTMDLATGDPVVFSRRTTPDVEVAGAVAASSAIPGAFPAGRAVFTTAGDGAVVHQLVDGGAWANYPAFVFGDRSFRAWMHGEAQARGDWSELDERDWNEEERRPVLGFALGETKPRKQSQPVGFVPLGTDVNRRFDQGPTYTSSKRVTNLFGAVLSSDWARLIIAVALAAWVALSVATLSIGSRRFATWLADWMPDILYPFALIGTSAVIVLALVVAIAALIVVVMISRILADTLVPSIKEMIGIPWELPPWIGLGDDAVVIRVPYGHLSRVDFGASAEICATAIEMARQATAEQLDDEIIRTRLEALFDGAPAPATPYRSGVRDEAVVESPDSVSLAVIVMSIAATTVVGFVAWWATNDAGAEGTWMIMLAIVIGIGGGGAALWYIAGRAGAQAAARARFGVHSEPRPRSYVAAVSVAAGVALVVAGAVLSQVAMNDRAETTVDARVLSAATGTGATDGRNVYVMSVGQGDDVINITIESDRHLRLGSRVFVQPGDDGPGRVVGALDDGRFAIAAGLWVLGLGLITLGVRWYRWTTRCKNLGEVVAGWAGGNPAAVNQGR